MCVIPNSWTIAQIHGRVAKSRHLSKIAAGCQNRENRGKSRLPISDVRSSCCNFHRASATARYVDAMSCISYGPGVRPSVRPSVTRRYSIKTTQARITKSPNHQMRLREDSLAVCEVDLQSTKGVTLYIRLYLIVSFNLQTLPAHARGR